jgi:hypothetical protein
MGRLRRAAGLVAISLMIAVACSETVLRFLRYRTPILRALLHSQAEPRPVRFDSFKDVKTLLQVTPFHPEPYQLWGGFKLNSLGFRTPEYTRAKPAGTYRIVALGDSFTFDSGFVPLDRMWHTLVGERIRERTAKPVEVINLGVPGVGPRFSLRLFELEGRHLAPDLVLFGLFIGNDLTDEAGVPNVAWSLEGSSLTWRLAKNAFRLARRAPAVLQQLRSLKRLPGSDDAGHPPGGYPVPGPPYDPEVVFGSEEAFLQIERNCSRIFASGLRAWVEERIADVSDTVAALDRTVRDSGGKLVVLIMPDQVQVDDGIRQAVVEGSSPPGGSYDFDWVQPAMVRRLADAGVTTVDLLRAFHNAPATPRLYRRRNTHWSAAGNALAAEHVVAFLAERRLMPTRRSP